MSDSEERNDESELSALLCDYAALCKWLRDNSSGIYRPSALAADKIEMLENELKWAYCKQIGADSIIGLDCCDNYREWRASLGA